MRIFKFFADLPWWTGLPILLAGTAIVVDWYAIGVIVALFGSWTFSKLMPASDFKAVGFAIIGFPLFFGCMLIPEQFSIETPVLDLLNGLSETTTYATRSALGLATSFIAFQSFR